MNSQTLQKKIVQQMWIVDKLGMNTLTVEIHPYHTISII